MSPLRIAVTAQLLGALISMAVLKLLFPAIFSMPLIWAFVQGGFAALVSHKLGAAFWWAPIHLVFLPLAMFAAQVDVSPAFWLGGFVLLLLLFWRIDKDQVPLYLSSRKTAMAVLSLMPPSPCSFIDLGCGTGSLLKRLAVARPDCVFSGIEHAPLPFLGAWLRSLNVPNLTIRYGDLWNQDLSVFQFVYAFLSPTPMPRLWLKACAEMQPGSQFISNSFEVPNVSCRPVMVEDRRRTRLYRYSPAGEQFAAQLKHP